MRYFDLHCDTFTEIYKRKTTLDSSGCAVSYDRCDFSEYRQAFAIFIPDELKGSEATEYFRSVADYAIKTGGIKNGFISVENGNMLAGDLDNLELLRQYDVKMFGLCWNGKNELCGGADTDIGLSEFGRRVITELEKMNIAVDVSHTCDRALYDVLDTVTKPIVASHSNARAVCPHRRNLDNRALKTLFSIGGLCGINFYPLFLGEGDVFERIYAHISHMLELGGEHSIALGADFDGADMDEKLMAIDRVPDLYYSLQCRGISGKTLDDIFFNNADAFFRRGEFS